MIQASIFKRDPNYLFFITNVLSVKCLCLSIFEQLILCSKNRPYIECMIHVNFQAHKTICFPLLMCYPSNVHVHKYLNSSLFQKPCICIQTSICCERPKCIGFQLQVSIYNNIIMEQT
jgi:hypothetical protein